MEDELGPFLPVERARLESLSEVLGTLERARTEAANAGRELLSLSSDLKDDAIARLAERGGSAAQVERYEESYRLCVERFRERDRKLDTALRHVREVFDTMK